MLHMNVGMEERIVRKSQGKKRRGTEKWKCENYNETWREHKMRARERNPKIWISDASSHQHNHKFEIKQTFLRVAMNFHHPHNSVCLVLFICLFNSRNPRFNSILFWICILLFRHFDSDFVQQLERSMHNCWYSRCVAHSVSVQIESLWTRKLFKEVCHSQCRGLTLRVSQYISWQ